MGVFRSSLHDSATSRQSSGTSLSARTVFTPRRAGITVVSAFACAGIFAVVSAGAAPDSTDPQPASHTHSVQLKLDQKSSTTTGDASGTNTGSSPATSAAPNTTLHYTATNGSEPTSRVTVNGKDVPVPQNGTTDQTFNDDSGQTSVHIQSNSSTDSSVTNDSSSSLNVNISSNSTADSGDDSNPSP